MTFKNTKLREFKKMSKKEEREFFIMNNNKKIITILCLVMFAVPAFAETMKIQLNDNLKQNKEINIEEEQIQIPTQTQTQMQKPMKEATLEQNSETKIQMQVQYNRMPARPKWEDTAQIEIANTKHKDSINRPKWAKPLAYVAEIGTLGIVPVASVMNNKDSAIADNNRQYDIYQQYKNRFENELNQCEYIFNGNPEELHGCYRDVLVSTQNNLNNITQNNAIANQTAVQKEQLREMQKQTTAIKKQTTSNTAYPQYTNVTVSKMGNTYYFTESKPRMSNKNAAAYLIGRAGNAAIKAYVNSKSNDNDE